MRTSGMRLTSAAMALLDGVSMRVACVGVDANSRAHSAKAAATLGGWMDVSTFMDCVWSFR